MPKTPDYTKFFQTYLHQEIQNTIDSKQDCIFHDCMKEKHLIVNTLTSEWHCVRCDRGGNARALITSIHQQYLDTTTDTQYDYLSECRGISADILKSAQFVYDSDNHKWYVPYFTYDPDDQDFSEFLNNLGYFNPNSVDPYVIKKAPTLATYLYNPGLHEYAPVSSRSIVCEGEWDTLAYYDHNRDTTDLVLGKAGSGFPIAALKTIQECNEVRFLLDNDSSGESQTAKAIQILLEHKKKCKIFTIDWSKIDREKWRQPDGKYSKDIRDMHCHSSSSTMMEDINTSYIEVVEQGDAPGDMSPGYSADVTRYPKITSFGKYFDELSKINLYGATTRKSIIACHAINTSITIPGRPLWSFVKGPASSGKTEFLESFGGKNQWFDYLSKLTYEVIVSGWVDDNPDTASYLGELINKNLIVKDFTQNLTSSLEQRVKLFGLFTDIYDGSINIRFGNRRHEEYHNINFNMLIGVTDLIESHSAASIGERFLRIDWLGKEVSPRDLLMRAMGNFAKQNENKIRLTELSLGFTRYLRDEPINLEVSPTYMNALADLGEFVANLRTKVEADRYQGLLYRPRPELPMRIGLQLMKLFVSARVVVRTDEEAYDVVRKVAFDTCYGFPLDVVNFIMENPRATREEISEGINVHSQRAYRVLTDLVTTGVLRNANVVSIRKNGRPHDYYELNPILLPALLPERYMTHENKHSGEREPNPGYNRVRPRRPTTLTRPKTIPK